MSSEKTLSFKSICFHFVSIYWQNITMSFAAIKSIKWDIHPFISIFTDSRRFSRNSLNRAIHSDPYEPPEGFSVKEDEVVIVVIVLAAWIGMYSIIFPQMGQDQNVRAPISRHIERHSVIQFIHYTPRRHREWIPAPVPQCRHICTLRRAVPASSVTATFICAETHDKWAAVTYTSARRAPHITTQPIVRALILCLWAIFNIATHTHRPSSHKCLGKWRVRKTSNH